MALDLATLAKEEELLFVFRSLTPEQQMVMLAMARGVYGKQADAQTLEADPPSTLH